MRISLRRSWPIVTTLLSAAAAALLLFFDCAELPGGARHLGLALMGLYTAWIVIESRVTLVDVRRQTGAMDRRSFELYALGRAATVFAGLGLPVLWGSPGAWAYLGLALFACGTTLRLVAIRTLGRFYSHRVRLDDGHRVVSSGPYRLVRHPSYAGILLAHLGYVLFFCNLASIAAYCLIFVPAVVYRIRVEERALHRIPGYRGYSRRRKRLVPGLW
jgi:protein-S-isoprenylcysteine O-methyltransferase Ste14